MREDINRNMTNIKPTDREPDLGIKPQKKSYNSVSSSFCCGGGGASLALALALAILPPNSRKFALSVLLSPVDPRTSPILLLMLEPIRILKASSSAFERLARAFFRGLPTKIDGSVDSCVDSGSPDPGTRGGVLSWVFVAGGVDTEAGVFDLDALALSPFPAANGSLEACRLSYNFESSVLDSFKNRLI